MSMSMYEPDVRRYNDLTVSMTNWTPGPEALELIEDLRESAKNIGLQVIQSCPDSRERAVALTHLEEVVMWAVKAIVLTDRRNTLDREEL